FYTGYSAEECASLVSQIKAHVAPLTDTSVSGQLGKRINAKYASSRYHRASMAAEKYFH
ncbi:hypothetical protein KIPB_014730, partial [Kipferlia bialata]